MYALGIDLGTTFTAAATWRQANPGAPGHAEIASLGTRSAVIPSVVLLPNVFVNLLPDHVVLHTLRPLGPARTLVSCDWLFDRAEMARPGFDPMDAVEIFDLVNRQDFEACELVQQSMTSRAYRDGGLYVPAEQALQLFNDWVLQKLGADQDGARL